MRHRGPLNLMAIVGAALATGPLPAAAQILSPGKLTEAHADLEGIRSCTRCHELRNRGVSRELCLSCHEPLAARLASGAGFHAGLAEDDCAACHKEHMGREFALVKLDTAAFDHTRTGYVLEGAHDGTVCSDCHRRSRIADPAVLASIGPGGRTFLGLPTRCSSCHAEDDPHGGEFPAKGCESCHGTATWDEAPGFDHSNTAFPLTGRHRTASCASCHVERHSSDGRSLVRFAPTEHAICTNCHQDPHGGAMPGSCEGCHATTDWRRVDRGRVERGFDHRSTGYVLQGRHAAAPCESCHGTGASAAHDPTALAIRFVAGTESRAFPRPVADGCSSCHVDVHAGVFDASASGTDCAGCHGQDAWLPTGFDLERHEREASFPLEGAHLTVPCADCHRRADPLRFEVRLGHPTCSQCHGEEDQHAGQFPDRGCETCHSVDSFRITALDHATTSFPLDGSHRTVPCSSCHVTETPASGQPFVRYTPLGTRCRDCHGGAT